MEFIIFNNTKKISISDSLIKNYEANVVPFNLRRAEYLAVTSGLDENNTEEEIKKGIIQGIYEEIETYKNKTSIVKKAKEMNLIP